MRVASEEDFTAARHYEQAAARYDTNTNSLFYGRIATALLDALRLPADPRNILEVGAGTGFATEVLRRRYPKAEIVALEPASAMAKRGRARVPDADWRTESLGSFPERRFDLLFSSMCWHWLSEDEKEKLIKMGVGGRLAVAASVIGAPTRTGPATGNAALRRVYAELRPKTSWGREDRRGRLILLRVGRGRDNASLAYHDIEESFDSGEELADCLETRGSLRALFGTRADQAQADLAAALAGGPPIVFHWQTALVTSRMRL